MSSPLNLLQTFVLGIDKGIEEQVSEQVVALGGEMHAVGLCIACDAPFVHGGQPAHDGKLVPNRSIGLLGDAIESAPSEFTVLVDSVFLA